MSRGRFITVEGGEGCGKSTLIGTLTKTLESNGLNVVQTREPGGTPLAESARELVLSPPVDQTWSALGEALIMNAARDDHVTRLIAPALEKGDWVLCDRFSDSTLVYQGLGGVREDLLQNIQRAVTARARPDMTLILDAPAEALLARRKGRGTTDIFESRPVEFHENVRKAFLAIAHHEPERCVVLDAQLPPEHLVDQAMQIIRERLVLV